MDVPTASRTALRLRLETDARRREIVAAVLLLAPGRGPDSIAQAIAGDAAAMIKHARQLFPLHLHGYRRRRKP